MVTEKEAEKLWLEFLCILYPIVEPTFPFLPESGGRIEERKTDYIAIAEYFRDNDFSEELSELESLCEGMKEFKSGEKGAVTSTRRNMRDDLDFLKFLVELRVTYEGKEITELSEEEKMNIYSLTVFKNWAENNPPLPSK